MRLLELFKSGVDLSDAVISDEHDDQLEIRMKIGGREIAFIASKTRDAWDIEFSEVEKYSRNDGSPIEQHVYQMTGSGNEYKVLTFVINCINYMIDKKNPEKISFSASKNDRARADVYEKMLKREIKGYTFTRKDVGTKASFVMEKN